jgi:hypothetical protein
MGTNNMELKTSPKCVQPGLPKAGLNKESMMKRSCRYPDNYQYMGRLLRFC